MSLRRLPSAEAGGAEGEGSREVWMWRRTDMRRWTLKLHAAPLSWRTDGNAGAILRQVPETGLLLMLFIGKRQAAVEGSDTQTVAVARLAGWLAKNTRRRRSVQQVQQALPVRYSRSGLAESGRQERPTRRPAQ